MLPNVVALTRLLVEIPSVSGEEAHVGEVLAELLGGMGLEVIRQPVPGGRFNVLAHGRGVQPEVVFNTHMDTVPPLLPFRETETHLYGRGVCDAKGILAAQLCALEQIVARGESRVGVLITVDEEVGGLGARIANTLPQAEGCRYVIGGEPTENQLATGSKGALRVRLQTSGVPAHSAYPEFGLSAIEALLDVLSDLRALPWPIDPHFGATTCNIGRMSGGVADNVIAPSAEATLMVRLTVPSEEVLALIDHAVAGRAAVEVLSVSERMAFHTVPGFPTTLVRYGTDLPYLTRWGTPLLYGPGTILVAHTDHEEIAKSALFQAVDDFARLATTLLPAP